MSNTVLIINLVVVYIPFIFLGYFMPSFIRKTLFFGVVIPEDISRSPEVLGLTKVYKRNLAISSVFIVLLFNVLAIKLNSINMLQGGIFALLICLSANYIYAHNKAKDLKEEKGWIINKKQKVIVETSKKYNESYLSAYWFLIPLGITIFALMVTMIQYPHLPERIPTRFDFMGEVLKYSDKSFVNAYLVPLTQIGMLGMFFFIFNMIKRVKPSIQASKPKTSLKQNQIAKRYWAIYILITAIAISIQFTFMQLSVLQIINTTSLINIIFHGVAIVVSIAGAVVVAVKTGQSGSRIKIEEEEEVNSNIIDRDDDKYWKWGMFYFNPDDPSLFIEKRFGIGWTMNFARPFGMIFIVVVLLLVIVNIIN